MGIFRIKMESVKKKKKKKKKKKIKKREGLITPAAVTPQCVNI